MKTGLIIGKFMPPHKGHLALIEHGIRNCDSLMIGVCSRPEEPIPGRLRYLWMKKLMKQYPQVTVKHIKANLPQDKEPSRRASLIWSGYMLKRFGRVDRIFSSELYGDFLADYMKTTHLPFDYKRAQVPVSATMIRNSPFKYWEYIPEIVRSYFVKKICIYGPESTGKTTLAQRLAEYFETDWVPEYARSYIAKNRNTFNYDDLERVAVGHKRAIKKALEKANKLLFVDTDAKTTLIYSQHYFNKISDIVKQLADAEHFDLYIFPDIDLPWVADPQRDLGERREEFKEVFIRELKKRNINFVTISGKNDTRLQQAIDAVKGIVTPLS